MSYSEKTQRALDKYTRTLVRRMPRWLRDLFDQNKITFVLGDSGELMLEGKDITQDRIDKASEIVGKYIDKHPNPVIGGVIIQ